jgi:hypothetical protein
MISPEIRAEIRRYFYAEHWKIGTIARDLSLHPDTMRNAIETQRLGGGQPVRPSKVDPYLGASSAKHSSNTRHCAPHT